MRITLGNLSQANIDALLATLALSTKRNLDISSRLLMRLLVSLYVLLLFHGNGSMQHNRHEHSPWVVSTRANLSALLVDDGYSTKIGLDTSLGLLALLAISTYLLRHYHG